MATGNANTGEVLNLDDVLTGLSVGGGDNAGACLLFQMVGNSTVISIDTDGPGPAAPIAILTLANVAGKTLQDLLNDIL